ILDQHPRFSLGRRLYVRWFNLRRSMMPPPIRGPLASDPEQIRLQRGPCGIETIRMFPQLHESFVGNVLSRLRVSHVEAQETPQPAHLASIEPFEALDV